MTNKLITFILSPGQDVVADDPNRRLLLADESWQFAEKPNRGEFIFLQRVKLLLISGRVIHVTKEKHGVCVVLTVSESLKCLFFFLSCIIKAEVHSCSHRILGFLHL